MKKFIFAIITLLGLSTTAELSAQFLSADLQADDLRGNVAKVEYQGGRSTYYISTLTYKYDKLGHLFFDNDAWWYILKITRNSNHKIQSIIEESGFEKARYTYTGNLISEIFYEDEASTSHSKLYYDQNKSLIRQEITWVSYENEEDCEEGSTIIQYTIVNRDHMGNWTKRNIKELSISNYGTNTETYTQTRKITYR